MPRLAFVMLLVAAVAARAQEPAPNPPAARPDTSLHVWATLALGPGSANGRSRVAGDIAVWLTRDRLAIWVRDATTARVFDPGDFWDLSVLAGIHPPSELHIDFIAGAGLGVSRGHDTDGANLTSQPALAFGAQLNWNYRVIGLGVDGFATVSRGRRYYGVGLAVGLGSFRAH